LIKLKEFKHQLGLFNIQLDKYYHQSIIRELDEANLEEEGFYRNAKSLESLIDIYLTFLIYKGYSASSITDYLLDCLKKEKHFKISTFYRFFSLSDRRYRYYLALEDIDDDITDFAELLITNYKVKVKVPGEVIHVDEQIGNKTYLVFDALSKDM